MEKKYFFFLFHFVFSLFTNNTIRSSRNSAPRFKKQYVDLLLLYLLEIPKYVYNSVHLNRGEDEIQFST